MTEWIPSATWNPVPGRLCSNSEFLANMDGSDDTLPIFGDSGLKNQGSIAARGKRLGKESFIAVTVTHSYPVPSCDSSFHLQRRAAADTAEKRFQRKAVRQQMRAEYTNPRI